VSTPVIPGSGNEVNQSPPIAEAAGSSAHQSGGHVPVRAKVSHAGCATSQEAAAMLAPGRAAVRATREVVRAGVLSHVACVRVWGARHQEATGPPEHPTTPLAPVTVQPASARVTRAPASWAPGSGCASRVFGPPPRAFQTKPQARLWATALEADCPSSTGSANRIHCAAIWEWTNRDGEGGVAVDGAL